MHQYVSDLRAKVGHELLMFPTVSAIVLNDADEILLGQRSDNHAWSIIAGMLDPGEQPSDGVLREIFEETGVRAAIDRVAGVALHEVTYPNGDLCHMVNTWFRCRAIDGEARDNDSESIEVGWFPIDRLPPMNPFAMLRIRTSLEKDAPTWFAPPGEDHPDLIVNGW